MPFLRTLFSISCKRPPGLFKAFTAILLPPNVLIHGEKHGHEVSEFYKMSDVLLFPSIDECNPIVLKEGISNNIKILAYNQKHYGDIYTNYIETLSGDVINDFELLLDTIHSPIKYQNDMSKSGLNLYQFAGAHREFYKHLNGK